MCRENLLKHIYMSEVLVHIVLVLCKGGYDMGNFLVIIMIYSGGKPLTVTVIMF